MAKNYKVFVLIVSILVLAGALRLIQIKNAPPGLYPDEAMNGNNALEALRTAPSDGGSAFGGKVFYPENNGREGLFINIQALFLKALIPKDGAPEPWMLRLPSAIFGILTVLGIYFLTKELFLKIQNSKIKNQNDNSKFKININEKIALLSTFLIATSFWHINFSRIGFRAIMAPAFLVWGIFLLLKVLNRTKNKSQITCLAGRQANNKLQINSNDQNPKTKTFCNLFLGICILSILAGLTYGLGFYSYIAYQATPLLILLIFWFYWHDARKNGWQKKFLISIFCFLLSALIVILPLVFYFINHPQDFFGRTTQISILNSPTPIKDLGINILKTAGMFNISGDWNWRHNISGAPLLFWPVGIFFIIGLAIGLRIFFEKISRKPSELRKEYSQAFLILFSWLIITAIPVVISNEGLPHALRSILMAPAVFIIAGIGAYEIYNWLLNKKIISKRLLLSTFYFLLAILIIEACHSYFIRWAKNPEVQNAFTQNYVSMAKEINALPKKTPKYIVVEASGIDVRGMPMPTQTVMFLTDTFSPEKQKEKNVFYVLPSQKEIIPPESAVFTLN